MALVVADRVKETTTTTGTGAYSLAGAEDSFQAFGDALSNNDTTYYAITDGTYWEVGIGTYTSSTDTLARTTILESSNSDSAVNWTAGEKQIFATMPADKVVYKDASGNIAVPGTVDGRDLATDGSKLDNIEANADVTDTANVTAAGALMDSEVANLAQVKAFDSSDYATAAQGSTADAALPKAGGTMTGAIRLDQDDKTGSGGTLTLDLAAANNFKISMTANTTIAFSNKNPGLGGNLIFVQDAGGGNSFTLPSECKTPVNGASIVQSTGANEISILSYYVLSSTQILVNYIGDFA